MCRVLQARTQPHKLMLGRIQDHLSNESLCLLSRCFVKVFPAGVLSGAVHDHDLPQQDDPIFSTADKIVGNSKKQSPSVCIQEQKDYHLTSIICTLEHNRWRAEKENEENSGVVWTAGCFGFSSFTSGLHHGRYPLPNLVPTCFLVHHSVHGLAFRRRNALAPTEMPPVSRGVSTDTIPPANDTNVWLFPALAAPESMRTILPSRCCLK